MAIYEAVSHERHALCSWHRIESFGIFSEEQTVPIVAKEFPRAAVKFPIAWVKNNGAYEPVGLLGLEAKRNLFVDLAGRWTTAYMPAHFRSQPFRLMPDATSGLTLAVREGQGLVTKDASGSPFFAKDGQLTSEVAAIVSWLRRIESNRMATQRATAVLVEEGLLKPWELIALVDHVPQRLEGLYHVDQERLSGLNAGGLAKLHDQGALAMAYCQQISQQLIQRLEMLHEQRAKSKVKQSKHPADQGGFGLGDDEGISFGGMAGNDDEG